ncbi:MAG: EFR1 family ferrodoxin [Syntrophomonadaceae bacterium]|nr:EFR1 family ferrodoxin [Syntrophomonadaceae bacterium]
MHFKMNTMYFSPTETTRKIVSGIADRILKDSGETKAIHTIDFTLANIRKEPVFFAKEDLVVIGVPVYAGRVPNVLLDYLNSISGNGALAVAVVVYGNRDYDDALIELKDILESRGFTVIAAGAFVGEHSFSKTLAADRPDDKDMEIVNSFAGQIFAKISSQAPLQNIQVKGNKPYRKYYVPKKENGEAVYDFRKITPKTNEDCIDCKLCAQVCPMESIDFDDVSTIKGICIKCCACIKKCPMQAKYFDSPDYLRHKDELEIAFARRSEPELFI